MDFKHTAVNEFDRNAYGLGMSNRLHVSKEPCPSASELLQLAEVLNVSVRQVKVWQEEVLVGCAVCYVEKHTVTGLVSFRMVGDRLHDYARLFVQSKQSAVALIKEMILDAKKCGADVFRLNGLIYPNKDVFFRRLNAVSSFTMIFDANKEAKGWNAIIGKKSLRRHWNKAKTIPGFRVEHRVGVVTQEDIAKISGMHRERWHFEGLTSAFDDQNRVREYLVHPSNKLITYVYVADEILCCHFGMLYEKVLLWHTPVINIKYLDLSPLEVLLMATAQFCSDSSLEVLDLGQGKEKYKERFSNAQRNVFTIITPLSFKAIFSCTLERAIFVLRNSDSFLPVKTRLADTKRFLINFRAVVRTMKASVIWFGSDRMDSLVTLPDGVSFLKIRSYPEYIDFCRNYSLTPLKDHYQRFVDGAYFLALRDDTQVYSFGWSIKSTEFYVGEIRRSLPLDGRIMLFDFQTPVQYRAKGYYTMLLHCIRYAFGNDKLTIFALSSNSASLKAIRRSGFDEMKSVCHENRVSQLISVITQNYCR